MIKYMEDKDPSFFDYYNLVIKDPQASFNVLISEDSKIRFGLYAVLIKATITTTTKFGGNIIYPLLVEE
jgi:hypothetical protein